LNKREVDMLQKRGVGSSIPAPAGTLNQSVAQQMISQRVKTITGSNNAQVFAPFIQSAINSYEQREKRKLDPMRRAILTNSVDALVLRLIRSGKYSQQMIKSAAVENVWDINSPITMLFNLLATVVPAFTFMEACSVQPMPTKKSPIIHPQLTANEEWISDEIEAEPRRIRSTYDLDNFYGAAKTLAGQNMDIDKMLATMMGGYINKEISCDIFDNILDVAQEAFTWDSTPPTSTDWYWHQASILGVLTGASNKIRQDVSRSSGNIIIADTALMSVFESIGGSIGGSAVPNPGLWAPEQYASEPIGPYVAGVFSGKYKVIKNQDYPVGSSVMMYKKDDLDGSYAVGVFLGLYATEPLGMDNLNVVQGMGTQLGEVAVFPQSIKAIEVVAS
jgi:hypothetical protein